MTKKHHGRSGGRGYPVSGRSEHTHAPRSQKKPAPTPVARKLLGESLAICLEHSSQLDKYLDFSEQHILEAFKLAPYVVSLVPVMWSDGTITHCLELKLISHTQIAQRVEVHFGYVFSNGCELPDGILVYDYTENVRKEFPGHPLAT